MAHIIDLRKKTTSQKPSQEKNTERKTSQPQRIEGHFSLLRSASHFRYVLGVGAVFVLIGFGFLIFQKSVITAVFFFLVVLVMFLISFKKSPPTPWSMDENGLTISSFYYPLSELRSFWIDYRPPHLKELSFQSKKWYYPYIKIPLDDHNPLEIRDFLLGFLSEERHEDTIVEVISRKLGI